MNIDTKIFLNTFYQIGGKVITAGIGLLVTMMLSRFLGVVGFGQYSFVFNFVGFLVIFADFGLTTLLTREVASKRADKYYISYIFTLRLFLTTVFLILGNILILFLPYSPLLKICLLLASVSNLFIFQSGPLWSIFQARLEFEKVVIPQLLTAIINALYIFYGIFIHAPLLYYVGINIIATSVGFFLSLWNAHLKMYFAVNKEYFLQIIKEAWPLGAGVLVSVAYFKIDSVLLSFFYNPSTLPDVGYYAIAYKIFEVVLVFGGFFTQTLFPFFSKNIFEKNFHANIKKFFLYTLVLSVLATGCMFIFSPLLLSIIGGVAFLPALHATQILSFAVGISILAGFFLNIGIAGNKQVLLLKFAIVALILNFILNLIIIPHYSFLGTSWTTVITQLFVLVTNAYVAYLVVRKPAI